MNKNKSQKNGLSLEQIDRDYDYRVVDPTNHEIDASYFITLPLKIDSFDTADISARMDFVVDGTIHVTESNALSDIGQTPPGYYPLRVMYTFITAQGQKVKSSEVFCWYIK